MALNFKPDEERARLDAIWAELEAERNGTKPEPTDTRTQEQRDDDNRKAKEARLENQDVKQIVSNAKNLLATGSLKTKWEKVLAKTLVKVTSEGRIVDPKEIAAKNVELNLLRNFAQAVAQRLENAEHSAKEQDNHHYYKIFAEGVKSLLEKL